MWAVSRFVQFPFVGGDWSKLWLRTAIIAPPFVSRHRRADSAAMEASVLRRTSRAWVRRWAVSCRVSCWRRYDCRRTLTFSTLTVPDCSRSRRPILPDAPFVNRLYGESSFTNMVVGAKIRLTGPNNALGFGFIPFYRWYPDKADDFSGFNQMQRGAGPGGDIGDFGLVGVCRWPAERARECFG